LPPGNTFERGTRQLLALTFKVLRRDETAILGFVDRLLQQEVADVNARVLEADFMPRLPSDEDWISVPNRIDDARFFVSQNYRDILGRLPDPEGLDYWTNEITACGSDLACVANRRIRGQCELLYRTRIQRDRFFRLPALPSVIRT